MRAQSKVDTYIHSYSHILKDRYNFEAKKQTLALGANLAINAAAAFPALFSSIKLMVELITRSVIMPKKSCQSGGLSCKRNYIGVALRKCVEDKNHTLK